MTVNLFIGLPDIGFHVGPDDLKNYLQNNSTVESISRIQIRLVGENGIVEAPGGQAIMQMLKESYSIDSVCCSMFQNATMGHGARITRGDDKHFVLATAITVDNKTFVLHGKVYYEHIYNGYVGRFIFKIVKKTGFELWGLKRIIENQAVTYMNDYIAEYYPEGISSAVLFDFANKDSIGMKETDESDLLPF